MRRILIIDSAVKDRVAESVSISPTFSGIPSPCPLHSSLTAPVSTRWNLPSAVLDGRPDCKLCPTRDRPWWRVMEYTIFFTLSSCVNSEVWMLCHFPEFPYRMKTLLTRVRGWLKVSLIGCTLFPESLLLTLTHVPWSLLLPIKCLHVNPWLGICFCWTKAKTGDQDHEEKMIPWMVPRTSGAKLSKHRNKQVLGIYKDLQIPARS